MLIVLIDIHFIIISRFGKPFRIGTCLLNVALKEDTNRPSTEGKETQRTQPFRPKAPALPEWFPQGTWSSRQTLYTHPEGDALHTSWGGHSGFCCKLFHCFLVEDTFHFVETPQNRFPKASFHRVQSFKLRDHGSHWESALSSMEERNT